MFLRSRKTSCCHKWQWHSLTFHFPSSQGALCYYAIRDNAELWIETPQTPVMPDNLSGLWAATLQWDLLSCTSPRWERIINSAEDSVKLKHLPQLRTGRSRVLLLWKDRNSCVKVAKITYLCNINTLRNQNKYPNKFGCRVALHVFWELFAFWSTEAWGQRCCYEYLCSAQNGCIFQGNGVAEMRPLNLTAKDQY